MDSKELEDEAASIELDILKLQLHSVPINLSFEQNDQEEEEDEEDGLDEDYLLSVFDDSEQPSTSGLNQHAETSHPPETTSVEAFTIADSEDEEDIVLEPEQEVIDLSADLSPTPENLLKLNVAYQEVIQQQLHFVDELLHQNRCKQDELEADMNDETMTEANTRKARPKADLGLCIAPFFRAGSLVGPPSHPDVLRRHAEIGENFITNAMQSNPWKAGQIKDLVAGVERDAIRVRTEPLLSKLEYLEEKYKMNETPELKDKMVEVRQKILAAKETKPSVLHGGRFDPHDWNSIANISLDGARSASECSIYWKNQAHPSINHKNWTSSEDEQLKLLARKYKEKDWPTIANELKTGRTALQCIQRYQRKINTAHKRKPWTPEEDEKLASWVKKYRVGDAIPYSMIALKMRNRSSTQVVHRWTKTVDPCYSKERWTAEEDILLLRAIAKHGTRWAYLRDIKAVPGRNDAQMRERYQNVLVPIRRGPWTAEEDDILAKAVEKHGVGCWAAVATDVEGRTDSQVMKRYNYLHDQRRKGREIQYKARAASQLHSDGIQKIRKRLMDSIREEIRKRKSQKLIGGFSIDEDLKLDRVETPSTSRPKEKQPEILMKLPKESKVKLGNLKKDILDPFYFAKDMGEKLKDMTTDEVFGLYQYVTAKKEKKAKKWNRKDALININMMTAISKRYRPYQAEARIKGTNLNIIREKVLETAKKITPRLLFTYHIRAMNVDAERTLSTIRSKGQRSLKRMRNGENKADADNVVETEAETNAEKEPEETPDAPKTSPFKRNFYLPLCAPHVATVRSYRTLMRDRDRRVKTAKTILIDRDAEDPPPENGENSQEPKTSEENSAADNAEKKYKPEELIKNFQLSQQHKLFRSRFVSLFAWPTILSTLVPYQKFGAAGELRPAIRLPKKDSTSNDVRINIKRRKTEKVSELNSTRGKNGHGHGAF